MWGGGELVNNNIIRRIFTYVSECVVFLIDTCSIFNDGIHDIVIIFTYFAPEKSPIYSPENDDGIVILNEKHSPLNLSIQKQKYFLQEIF